MVLYGIRYCCITVFRVTVLQYVCNAWYGMVLLIGIQSIINAQLIKKSRYDQAACETSGVAACTCFFSNSALYFSARP